MERDIVSFNILCLLDSFEDLAAQLAPAPGHPLPPATMPEREREIEKACRPIHSIINFLCFLEYRPTS